MRALITGASGFIGSTLIEELNRLGFEVSALMRSTSSLGNLGSAQFERVEGDLTDFESLKRAVKGMQYVFHLAGMTAAPNREAFMRANARGTGLLAQAVAEAAPELSRFVHVSSLAAGGPSPTLEPRTETHLSAPVSAYGESKLRGEQEVLKFKDRFPVTIIRPPLVYGPRDRGVFVIIKTVSRNLMPMPAGKGEGGHKYYSAVHVKDLCRGIIQGALVPLEKAPSGEVFYICDDRHYTYHEFLSSIAEALGKNPLRIKVPVLALRALAMGAELAGRATGRNFPLNLDKLNELIPDYWICSNQKARRVLDYKPELPLSRGMLETVEWYKENGWL